MRIAIVIESYDPTGGGAERSTEQIARRLARMGHSVTVLTNRGKGGDTAGSAVRVVAAGGAKTSTAWGLLRFRRWAMRRLARSDYDVSLSMTLAVPCDVVQPRGGTVRETLARNIAMRRTGWQRLLKRIAIALNPKQLALLWAEARTLRDPKVKKIVAISRYVGEQLFRHYTVPARRITPIPNAAEVRSCTGEQRAALRQHVRRSMGLDDEAVVFLFAAMNPALKGADPLIRAFARLSRQLPKARLVIVGSQDAGLRRRVQDAGLNGAALLLGPTRKIDDLYAAADVTVLPTFYDPSSKVVLESLLHGVPAISTRYNGASQFITNPTGEDSAAASDEAASRVQPAGRVIAEPTDVDALLRAMIDLCDPAERARCAAAAVGLDRHISMDRHVEQLEAVLRQCHIRESAG